MPEIKRVTAVKTDIASVKSGRFVRQTGFNPSYILTALGQRLSRVRILASVVDSFVSADSKYATITIDDNTDTIRVKSFQDISLLQSLNKGDMIDVIGKIREYNGEIYITPEIIYRVEDPNLLLLRRVELQKQEREQEKKKKIVLDYQNKTADIDELKKVVKRKFGISEDDVESIIASQDLSKRVDEEQVDEKLNKDNKDKIIKLIEKIDSGNGCEYSTLISESGLDENTVEQIVNDLLNDGICFEPKPGIIKLL